jgi:hypothetical protein
MPTSTTRSHARCRERCCEPGDQRLRSYPATLIDLEEDRAARAVVFGLLREMERK